MTTDRVYKKGISHKEAIAEIIKLKGIKYDEKIVDIFVNCFKLNKFF
jgi:HD-GYP domain-containing protein (c-di-GMP phosphodiesterase class II)